MEQKTKTYFINQPYLMLVIGLPGSGKTFFAEKFAQAFNTTLINLNDLRFELFAQPNFSKDEESHLEKIGRFLLPELMRSRRAIMLEGCLEARSDREAYRQIAKQHGYQVVTIWVQNTENTTRLRSTKKLKQAPRKYLLNDEQFLSMAKRFTVPNLRENPVVISGNHTFSTQARSVLRKLSHPELNLVAPRSTNPKPDRNDASKIRRFI